MRLRKKGFLLVLALVMVFAVSLLVAGCGGSGNEKSDAGGDKQEPAQKFVMKFGHVEPAGSIHDDAALLFKERVEAGTNGNVTVEIYPAQQLGNPRAEIEATQANTQQATMIASANFTGFYPPSTIVELPFLFPDRETCYEITDGPLGEEFLKGYNAMGVEALAFMECGFKQFTGNFPINKPSDYKGKKIRVMENPVLIAEYQAMGASATPISFGETYNALQQNVVDGHENPFITIYDMKFYEVQDYLTVSDHAWLPLIFIVNKQWYDSLPADYQKVVKEAATEARDSLRAALLHEEEDQLIPDMEASGIKITYLTDEQKQAFSDAMREPCIAAARKLMDEKGNAMLDKFLAAVEEQK